MTTEAQLFPVTTTTPLPTMALTAASTNPTVTKELETSKQLLAQVPRVEITDEESYAKAGDLVKLLKASRKTMDDTRKALTGPVDKAIKAVNKFFKDSAFTDIDEAETEVKAKMTVWFLADQARRKKEADDAAAAAEAQALEDAAALEEQGHAAAADAVLEQGADTAQAEQASVSRGPARGSYGSTTSARGVWKWRIEDEAKIPREYLMVDTSKIGKLVRGGKRDIAGIEIYKDTSIAVR